MRGVSGLHGPATLALAAVLAAAPRAGAQPDGATPPRPGLLRPSDDAQAVARLWGVLTYRRLSVSFEATPAREAVRELARRLDVPLVGRFADDAVGHGIDPATPITLELDGVPAVYALEELLEQCGDDCTWQIRRGFVELGTRARLSVPAARERRLYYIRDFLIDTNLGRRLQPEYFALNVVEDIVENIEPDAWDFGQIDYYEERLETGDERHVTTHEGDDDPAAGSRRDRAGRRERAVPLRRHVAPVKIATIRYWRDVIVVTAPDYLHRQIDGYPEPIPPPEVESAGALLTEPEAAAEAASALTSAAVTMRLEAAPARAAFEKLETAIGAPLLVRYRRGPGQDGIDPAAPITLDVTGAPALRVLEEILGQCGGPGECTWQARRGTLEAGTKRRLSVPDARTLRVYYVRDLTIDVEGSRSEQEMAAELIAKITAEIEPGQWHAGENERADYLAETPEHRRTSPGAPAHRRAAVAGAAIATIQYRDGGLVVRAPDFVHRQLDGYLGGRD